ncbi:sulfatase family protein [Streptomyces sp. CMB-StM0423]|uniref:sulfatase family protein n=1 Tax=Streptomyces sp. CMB-StM0423 TaxID=2059884 RepID=UPI000C7054A1|nr:sulfatase-like hydrolase/transferase [Streptomyces sp. CMB-StM0423]AUH41697.1 sulfatase [Streptomyces sp. CMB-StM0423]
MTCPTAPNIVFVMTDQFRADFTAGEGFGLDTMPFLDSLAAGGVRLRRAYTTAPACVPARTSVLTGRWPSAHRVRQNSTPQGVVRGDDLLDVLGGAGYQLFYAGKTHMYRGRKEFFDAFSGPYGHESGPDETVEQQDFARWMRSIDHGPTTEATPFPVELQFAHRIVSDAMGQISARDPGKPFFSWISMPEPHNPYQAPEPYFSLFGEDEVPARTCGPEAAERKGGAYKWLRELVEEKRPGYDRLWRRYRATYCGMLRLIDDQLRRLVDHLKAQDVWRDTLLVFFADHGDYVGDYGLQRKGAGMPEVLARIPMVVHGCGVEARDNRRDFVSLADLLPTVCEAVGRPLPLGVQGRSMWPMLTGADYPAAEFADVVTERGYGGLPYPDDARPELHFPYEGTKYDELNSVTQSGSSRMLRHDRYKLYQHVAGEAELYDVAADPMELHDRWNDPRLRHVQADLTQRLHRWSLRLTDDLPDGAYDPLLPAHNWHRGEGD